VPAQWDNLYSRPSEASIRIQTNHTLYNTTGICNNSSTRTYNSTIKHGSMQMAREISGSGHIRPN
ncbi:hypothetical protein H4S04_006373, partial [Coemansia sp. S16]